LAPANNGGMSSCRHPYVIITSINTHTKGRRFVLESRFDWTNLLIGIFMIIVGILVLANPTATMTTLAILLGIAVLVSGVIFLFKYKESTANLIYGIIAIILGIILLTRPAFAVSALGFIIGIWFFIEGVLGLTRAGFYKLISSAMYITSIILNVLLLIA